MNKRLLILAGLLLTLSGLTMAAYVFFVEGDKKKEKLILETIREGEVLLEQNNLQSSEKALSIFTNLFSKIDKEGYDFRISYGLARALDKTGDKENALSYYRKLNTNKNLKKEDSEKLSYALGNLLLKMNKEEEGKIHLNLVLKNSEDKPLRSKALESIADFYFDKKDYLKAKKNYALALEEDPHNQQAKLSYARVLEYLGKDLASYEVLDEYVKDKSYVANNANKVKQNYKLSVFLKAKRYFLKKNYWSALKYFHKARKLYSDSSSLEEIYYFIGESYNNLGRFKSALPYFEKVLQNPGSKRDQAAYYRKGTIYFRMTKYSEAASFFQAAEEKFPKSFYTEKAKEYRQECLKLLSEDAIYSDPEEQKKTVTPSETEAPVKKTVEDATKENGIPSEDEVDDTSER
ncbi:MAG: tetratricopeptide repeat protein [Leptospiraceae bacterium]|nr:tetratricopeptide repeat protein [Leptospiraceae bacterium]MCP5500242.1 tetratricopeptide repeat protein [Leptospiraceae bacterium]